MDLNEAASLLGVSKERAQHAIEQGIELPITKERVRLKAVFLPHGWDIAQDDLDTFIAAFEHQEPGRHPPVSVRRILLIECGYKCSVCWDSAPLDFHHIIEWAAIKHHDAEHMLAVCATCHSKITRYGQPDVLAQREIKKRVQERAAPRPASAHGVDTATATVNRPSVSRPRAMSIELREATIKAVKAHAIITNDPGFLHDWTLVVHLYFIPSAERRDEAPLTIAGHKCELIVTTAERGAVGFLGMNIMGLNGPLPDVQIEKPQEVVLVGFAGSQHCRWTDTPPPNDASGTLVIKDATEEYGASIPIHFVHTQKGWEWYAFPEAKAFTLEKTAK